MQKTILITLSRGSLIRNILKTRCMNELANAGHKLVMLVPEGANLAALRRIVPGATFETLHEAPWTLMDVVLNGIYKSIGYNRHTRANDLYGIFSFSESSLLKYWLRKIFFLPIARFAAPKRLVRSIDERTVYSGVYAQLFDTHKPDVVFATSIVGDTDIEVVKEAKRRGIPVAGMPKSWDNLPKVCLRVEPEATLVWGERSRYEAERFSGISRERIHVVGASQFDHYYNRDIIVSRDEFCREWGIDPNKKIIMFGSEGKVMKHDGEVAAMIVEAVDKGEIKGAHVIARPHFIYKGDADKFSSIRSPNVTVDRLWNPDTAFRDSWDYSDEQIKRFTNLMHHADVVVTSVSTLSVDACVTGKPVINYYFDGAHNVRHEHSMRRWFEREHYYHIVENHSVSLAWNRNELIELINRYLEHPEIRARERAWCVEHVGGPPDGKAGARMGAVVLDMLKTP